MCVFLVSALETLGMVGGFDVILIFCMYLWIIILFISPSLDLRCRIQFDGINHSEVHQALRQWWLFIRFWELTESVRSPSKRQETMVCDKDTLLYRCWWFCKNTLFVCLAVNRLVRHDENIFIKPCIIENNNWWGKFCHIPRLRHQEELLPDSEARVTPSKVRHEHTFKKPCVIDNNDWWGEFCRTKEFTNKTWQNTYNYW